MIKKWHDRLDKIVGGSKGSMVVFCLMFGSFLLGAIEAVISRPDKSFWNGTFTGASLVMTFMALTWYFEAKIKEDDAGIATNHVEADRLEAELQKLLEEGK